MTGFYQFDSYFNLDLDLTSVLSLVAPSRFSTSHVGAVVTANTVACSVDPSATYAIQARFNF